MIGWSVQIESAPTVVRYCKKCGTKIEFTSSGLFRVNAQQKSLDVWLIYKCSKCESTWNLTVLSRVNPRSIPTETLNGFHCNSPTLAKRYASDIALIKHNGGEPGMPTIKVLGESVDLQVPTKLHILPEYPMEIRVSAFLRSQLELSRSEYDRLCENETIRCISGQDLKKCKLSGEIVLEIG